jgi:antibiotic biosynthesis monooxygenase (ABM) superfamily enzyme
MQHCVEFVRLRVQQGREEEFLRNRPRAIEAIAEKFPGFVGAPVNARVGDHEWVDVWIYATKEEADAANAQAEGISGFMAYASLAEIVNIEVGWMPVDSEAPA